MTRAEAIVREIRRKYTAPTAGCADARLACDEIMARLRREARKRRVRRADAARPA